ncbi:hypothetical protein DOTSEDRAFT_48209 [Dothistroma septosporum NZE10]|uniref:Uncharacterized protein n=1 Tax=Dothistroma septosporum (strain NZE10 / CBS 128990) TaxID=675120 RepID=M2XGS4_DOTSN|nr:hypothetical protein DOTSEDRAFT_48209 [Dothistroma septosporum NZE10]
MAIEIGSLALLVVFGTALCFTSLYAFHFHYSALRTVPGPTLARLSALWRVRLIWSGDAPKKYRDLHQRYGPIVRTAPNVVDVSDPGQIPVVLGINAKFVKSDFYTAFDTVYDVDNSRLPSMFSTTDPAFHRHLKRPVAHKYSLSSLRSLERLVNKCSQIFTDAMLETAGQSVDMSTWLQWYAFDVIGEITFSRRFGFMEQKKDVEGMIEGIDFGLWYNSLVGQLPWLHPFLLGNSTARKLLGRIKESPLETINRVTREAIRAHNDAPQDKDKQEDLVTEEDFLTFLSREEAVQGNAMPDRDKMNHLLNNLFAGSDTTAISLRAVFYQLMRHPEIYRQVQTEIVAADNAGKLSWPFIKYTESLEHLPFLHMCIKEAMRVHPGVGFPLERVVPNVGAKICDTFLPGGTIVGINAAVIHYDKDIFGEDAAQFRPNRWVVNESNRDAVALMERNLLIFGAGARSCIGKNISILEMGKFIPQILRAFDVTFADARNPEWKVRTFWFSRQSEFRAVFTPRKGPEEAPEVVSMRRRQDH